MIKSYILYDSENTVTQFTRCDESEIGLYQSSYIEITEDNFEFDSNNMYTIENGIVVKTERTDEAYLKQISKANIQALVKAIEVEYDGVIYQGDETSQDRISRAINSLPDEVSTIYWKAKDNSAHALNKLDLKKILYLAVQEQTKILVN